MLTIVERILFVLLALGCLYYGGQKFYAVYRAIGRGKADARFDHLAERIRRALWVVLTQQSVFKKRPIVSLLHAFVFYGFVFYFLVNFVDLLEGFFGIHARGGMWNLFNLAADLFTTSVLIGIIGLVLRRLFVRPKDFEFPANVPVQPEVRAGIFRDSTLVAGFIIFHVGCRLLFKATQLALEGRDAYQPVSSAFGAAFAGLAPGGQELLNHFFWWGALGSILLFIPYFPRSKHIHIFLAPVKLALKKDKAGVLQP
ncbi:MAG TPA: [Fe-S]-binding protein, partial [Terriglobia bacterium]|nr:[Fe-S]-binding protein [Terriglobia bacterium]